MRATLRRLSWQIPVLLLLPSLLVPAGSWHSVWFGPWPLWLAAMPLTACWLARRSASLGRRAARPARAQVLVFPSVAGPRRSFSEAPRRAA